MYSKSGMTKKRALTDHRSKNLDLWSHPLTAIYIDQVESSGSLHRDRPKLVKAYGSL
jgi:hypothetical protein